MNTEVNHKGPLISGILEGSAGKRATIFLAEVLGGLSRLFRTHGSGQLSKDRSITVDDINPALP